jgi:hypothetical protein
MAAALYFALGENAVYFRCLVVLTSLVVAAPAAAISSLTGPPNFRFTAPAPLTVAVVDNGDFARGLEGWQSTGRETPQIVPVDGGLAAVLRLNTTLASPPFTVPPGAQTIAVVARAPSGGALLEASARPEDGSPPVVLGTVAPGVARGEFRLPAAALQGRVVRLVLDPVSSLGRSVEVGRVGPVQVVTPLWTVVAGVAQPSRASGRTKLRVVDAPFEFESSSFTTGAAARALIVAVRGDGRVTARVGSARRSLEADTGWRDLRVPVRPGTSTIVIRVVPGAGAVEIADPGLVVRSTSVSSLKVVRRGAVVEVRGRVVPAGAGLRVTLSPPSGRSSATTRSAGGGRFVLRARIGGRVAALRVTGDRTRLGARRVFRLPAAPPAR